MTKGISLATYHLSVMDQNLRNLDVSEGNDDIKANTNRCNQCNYASSKVGNFNRHLKSHSGEKLDKCNQCGFASYRADSLRMHLKIHSGEKSNKCNQCDYTSSEAGNLRRHLKTHSGEKPNKCNQCELCIL